MRPETDVTGAQLEPPVGWPGVVGRHRLVIFILLVAICFRAFVAIATPPLFAPDEAAHVLYVHVVATRLEFPVQSTNPLWALHFGAYEFYQPPLYYLLMSPLYRLLVPLGVGVVLGLRLANVALSFGLLILIYRTCREVLPRRREIAEAGLAFASFLPTFVAVSANVNNDVLVDVEVAMTSLLLIGALRSDDVGLPRLALVSALVVAGLYTKTSAAVLIPTIAIWAWFMGRGRLRSIVRCASPALIGLAAIAPWWYLRNHLSYGDFLGIDIYWPHHGEPRLLRLMNSVVHLATTFWSSIGRIYDIQPPRMWIYVPAALVLLLAAIGLTRMALWRSHDRSTWWILVLLFAQLLMIVTGAVVYGVRFGFGEGRYLFPVLPTISLLVGAGASILLRPLRRYAAAGLALAGALYLLALLGLFAVPGFARVRPVDQVGVADGDPFRAANYDTWIAHRQAPLRPDH